MTDFDKHANLADAIVSPGSTVIGSAIGDTIVAESIETAERLPDVPFKITVWRDTSPEHAAAEIMRATAYDGQRTFTVDRAQEGTAALDFIGEGWRFGNTLTAGDFDAVEDAVTAEEIARAAADTALEGEITAEATARAAADTALEGEITAEATARAAADTALEDAVTAEATARAAADTALEDAVTAEATARAAADTALEGEITAEAALRVTGDANTLASAETYADGKVAAEAALRVTGDANTLAAAEAYADAKSQPVVSFQMSAATIVGAVALSLKSAPPFSPVGQGKGLLVVGAYTAAAEVVIPSAINGAVLTVPALANAHAAGDLVIWAPDTAVDVRWFGAKGDGISVADAAMTNGDATLTSATAAFQATDVGKVVLVIGAGAAGVTLKTTITAYLSVTQVTLAVAAASTVAGATMLFGTDDTAAFSAIFTGNKTTAPRRIEIPASLNGGAYLISKPNGYQITSGQAIVGIGKPTIQVIGGDNANTRVFFTNAGVSNWEVRGIIIDGGLSYINSSAGGVAIGPGRRAVNFTIRENEFRNLYDSAIGGKTYVAGDVIGSSGGKIIDNYIHDLRRTAGGPSAMFLTAISNYTIIGNRIVNTYDDQIALISAYVDANDACHDCYIAGNYCDTSDTASNIAISGFSHIVIGNECRAACQTAANVEPGSIRIRPSNNDNNANKRVPYDIVCVGNLIYGGSADGSKGSCGILAECARSRITDNEIHMTVTTSTTTAGIKIYTSGARTFPAPAGELVIDDNAIYGAYIGIQHVLTTAVIPVIRIRRNTIVSAISHGILLAPLAGTTMLDVRGNNMTSCGGDGIHLSGTWTEAKIADNDNRSNTGYGISIPAGVQTLTRVTGNTGSANTAGNLNLVIATLLDHVDAGSPNAAVLAKVGSKWTRTDGGAGSTLYVNTAGTNAWTAYA